MNKKKKTTKKVLRPTKIREFDRAINEFNYHFNKGDKVMAKYVLKVWVKKQGRILSRLEIMAEKLKDIKPIE